MLLYQREALHGKRAYFLLLMYWLASDAGCGWQGALDSCCFRRHTPSSVFSVNTAGRTPGRVGWLGSRQPEDVGPLQCRL